MVSVRTVPLTNDGVTRRATTTPSPRRPVASTVSGAAGAGSSAASPSRPISHPCSSGGPEGAVSENRMSRGTSIPAAFQTRTRRVSISWGMAQLVVSSSIIPVEPSRWQLASAAVTTSSAPMRGERCSAMTHGMELGTATVPRSHWPQVHGRLPPWCASKSAVPVPTASPPTTIQNQGRRWSGRAGSGAAGAATTAVGGAVTGDGSAWAVTGDDAAGDDAAGDDAAGDDAAGGDDPAGDDPAEDDPAEDDPAEDDPAEDDPAGAGWLADPAGGDRSAASSSRIRASTRGRFGVAGSASR
jgi:hypothetical protein